MKISMNSIGNYSPQSVQNVNRPVKNSGIEKPKAENITKSEKEFFANLYPEKKEEVMDYHFYHKSGKMSGVTVGSLFDKRG